MTISPLAPQPDSSQPLAGMKQFIDVATLADYLGVPVSTVYDWRVNKKGPAAYRFGKHIMFAVSDVSDWIEQQRDPAPPIALPWRQVSAESRQPAR
jgi:excisionase family DNA binding protein